MARQMWNLYDETGKFFASFYSSEEESIEDIIRTEETYFPPHKFTAYLPGDGPVYIATLDVNTEVNALSPPPPPKVTFVGPPPATEYHALTEPYVQAQAEAVPAPIMETNPPPATVAQDVMAAGQTTLLPTTESVGQAWNYQITLPSGTYNVMEVTTPPEAYAEIIRPYGGVIASSGLATEFKPGTKGVIGFEEPPGTPANVPGPLKEFSNQWGKTLVISLVIALLLRK